MATDFTQAQGASRPQITTHFPFWQNGRKPFSPPFGFERPDEPHVVAREAAMFRAKMDDVLVGQGFRRDSAELAAASDRIIGQLSKNDRNLLVAGMNLPPGIMALIEAERTKAGIATARPVNEFGAEAAKQEADGKLVKAAPANSFDLLERRRLSDAGNTSNAPKGGFASSVAFTGLKDDSNPAYIAARDFAVRNGMDWAPPELLRLGQEAVKTMHAMGFDRQIYGDMTKRGKFEAAQVVAVAGFAKKHNMTPEQAKELARSATDVSESLGQTDPELQRRFRKDLTDFFNSKDDPAAWQRVDTAMQEAEKRNPSIKAQTDQFREQVGKAQEQQALVKATTETDKIAAETEKRRTAELGAQVTAKASVFGGASAAPATETTNPSTPSEGAKPAQQASAEPKKPTAAAPVRGAQSTPAP